MARPKSTKPIKDKILSVRLTQEDYTRIKSLYGSIQVFLDEMIVDSGQPADERELKEIISQNEKDLDDRLKSLGLYR